MALIKSLESATPGTQVALEAFIAAIPFDANGLIAGIAQQYDSGEVLMLGWLNADALRATISGHEATYYSRSRRSLWRKGETSGQVQRVVGLRLDCDGDALLLLVDQTGAACHTGRRSCFYLRVDGDVVVVGDAPLVDPATLYPQ